MSTETILVLGASFAGIGAAHYALKHIVPQLPQKDGTTYSVTLVNPSKDFFYRIAGPRAAVSKQLMPPSKYFYPIEPAFKYAGQQFRFIQGSATHVDGAARTVTVSTPSGEQQIPYTALVIATGVTTRSPLFTQATSAADLESTYDTFQKSLRDAKTVVIGGAGPVGVETAGEVAEFLNGKPGWLAGSEPKDPKAKITLICAEKQMLPVLRESLSKAAEKSLKRLGVDVIYSTKVVSSNSAGAGGKTAVQLSDGQTIETDIYIDATGTIPNTSFLPQAWLDNRNRVSCNSSTLRVEAGGPRVYVVGDAGSYTRGGVMDQYDAIPVALTNLKTDLVTYISGAAPGPDRHYKGNTSEQQIVPIGSGAGVGAMGGYKVPSMMVAMIKGRDYMAGMLAAGALAGDRYKSEGK